MRIYYLILLIFNILLLSSPACNKNEPGGHPPAGQAAPSGTKAPGVGIKSILKCD
jgi:hypothetical protein